MVLKKRKKAEPTVKVGDVEFRHVGESSPDVPASRPYIFRTDLVKAIKVAVDERLNLMLTGPAGCGKTSLPLAIAAEIGQPVLRLNMSGESRVSHFVGQQKPAAEGGVLTLRFSYGAVARAMREGYWLILDELDAAQPNVLMSLQSVLEDEPSLLIPETGECLRRSDESIHPRFRIFATGNTVGYRSTQRAAYAGTGRLNTALLDRFGMVLTIDYPEKQDEVKILRTVLPEVDKDFAEGICRVATELRKDSKFSGDFSTRRLIQWARLLPHFDHDEQLCADMAITRKLENPVDAKVFREISRRIFGRGPEDD